jgi:hypothetical protein
MSTAMSELRRCIYCERDKPLAEFSLEHIFPQSWGGALCNDLFKTDHVCQKCNSLMGIFVDGAMIRNWFTKQAEANAYRGFVDLDANDSRAPYTYMGPSNFMSLSADEVLEIWVGFSGEHVYHIHRRDDPRYDTYVGGDPIKRNSDPGRAYLFLTSTEQRRYSLAIRSFERQFKASQRYAGNFEIGNQTAERMFVHAPDDSVRPELEALTVKVKADTGWQLQLPLPPPGFEQRFLAKIARSLGFKLFGDSYLTTSRAKILKEALWEKDYERRSQMLGYSAFFSDQIAHIAKYVGNRGAYSVIIQVMRNSLVLCLTMPSGTVLPIVISDAPELWSGKDDIKPYLTGVVYVIAPQVDFFLGPISLPEFLAYKLGTFAIPQLTALEGRRKQWPPPTPPVPNENSQKPT